ncbi:MAG: type II toxin-antitoxin system VapB family antitoxin [Stellaceae bacterium]
MAFHVRDDATDAVVRKLAKRKKKTLTDTIREAAEHEYEREYGEEAFMEAIKALQDELDAISQPGGLPVDKTFYDELSGEEELTGIP